jgi:hypothetical protein
MCVSTGFLNINVKNESIAALLILIVCHKMHTILCFVLGFSFYSFFFFLKKKRCFSCNFEVNDNFVVFAFIWICCCIYF